MAPTFSNPVKVVTVTASVDLDSLAGGYRPSDREIQAQVTDALARLARSNGVTAQSIDVTVADGPRTVTLTEEEYNALRQGSAPAE